MALGEGVWHVAAEPPPAWRAAPPVFVRHVMPVDREVPLAGGSDDLVLLAAAAAELAPRVDPARSISVQTRLLAEVAYRSFDVNEALAHRLPAPVDVRRPAQILSVVVAGAGPLVGYLGLSTPAENLSDWAGGMRRLARDEGQVSRAEGKLVEALEVFALDLPEGGVAVDLGAAPGGWTRVLHTRGLRVHAVDPAALDPRVAALPGVRWHPTTAERWLASAPGAVDIVVADMKMDTRDAVQALAPLARLVRRWALLTLKLPGHDQLRKTHAALDLLARQWRIIGARQLFHNRSEVTVALAPRDPRPT